MRSFITSSLMCWYTLTLIFQQFANTDEMYTDLPIYGLSADYRTQIGPMQVCTGYRECARLACTIWNTPSNHSVAHIVMDPSQGVHSTCGTTDWGFAIDSNQSMAYLTLLTLSIWLIVTTLVVTSDYSALYVKLAILLERWYYTLCTISMTAIFGNYTVTQPVMIAIMCLDAITSFFIFVRK
uniref:Uncharacterized protein n=1 Tax=Clandestinovirus TaxID=2831644 RepID=A0A8F8KSH7_9VIRU|nr:hypothetical protein KOM_12_15 [Clandestinovirus]